MSRTQVRLVLLVLALAGAFAYGYLSHRNRLFPYGLLERAADPGAGGAAVEARQEGAPAPEGGAGDAPSPQPASGRRRAPWVPEGAPPGSWRRAAPEGEAGEDAARLVALPYLQGYRKAEDRPVITRHLPERAYPGLNLYLSGHAAEAILADMQGKALHRWRYPLKRLWPDLFRDPEMEKLEYWRRAHLLDDGSLLAIYEGTGLIKLDPRSRPVWSLRGGYHHDLEVAADGTIHVLDREGKLIPEVNATKPVLEDFITVLDAGGRVLSRTSVLESFQRSAYAPLLHAMPGAGDILHTNTLELLDGRFAGQNPAFRKGNYLISVLFLDTVAVIDPRQEKVVWALSGLWRRQHQPTFVGDGNLLVFDNQGAGRRRSRVLEIDPLTQQVAWSFGGARRADLFSRRLGSCQRLPNGNTLITESEAGRALEVARDGTVVWELYNPHRAGKQQELIATLFEVVRLPQDFPFRGLAAGAAAR
jgi:Arylsulfotransferase (ASST)